MIDRPIFITGAARSGTSLVAGIFNLCGAWGGQMAGPNRNNQKGMFENVGIKSQVLKPYLRSIGCDQMGQKPLPDIDMLVQRDVRTPTLEVIKHQGYRDGIWMYKGAKMCLFFPVWAQSFPEARWIIVRRPDKDIISSCLRTSFMRAYKDRAGWQGWVDVHKKRFSDTRFGFALYLPNLTVEIS